MTSNDTDAVREASGERVHRLSIRLLLVAAAALVVGVGFLLWSAWASTVGIPVIDDTGGAPVAASLADRAFSFALYSAVGPLLLLSAVMLLCSALMVVRRPWDPTWLPPSRGLGLQPEIVGVTAAASLLALVQMVAAFLALTVTGPMAYRDISGSLVADLAANCATLCLAALLTAQWWASTGQPSGTEHPDVA